MIKDIKKTAKHSLVYSLGNIATKIIGFILIPLYTDVQYISHDSFGALALLEATSLLLVSLLSFSMQPALSRWYLDEKFKEKKKNIFFTTLFFLLITTIPISGVLLFYSKGMSILIFETESFNSLVRLAILASTIQIFNSQSLILARLQFKSLKYTSFQLFKFILSLVLILWGILVQKKGIEAVLQANLIAEGVILILLLPYTIKNCAPIIEKSILKEMLKYGLPLMLASISGIILTTTDRYMINSISGLKDTGIYSLALRLSNTLKIVITASVSFALGPLKLQKMNSSDNKRFYSKSNTYTAFLFILGLLALSLFSLELIKAFTDSKEYWEANFLIPIISYALFFGLLKDNIKIALTILKDTKIISILIVITSILNIGLNYIFINLWNLYGAAAATLLSQIFFFSSLTYVSQKRYYIPYEWKKILTLIGVSLVIILTGLILEPLDIWIRLSIKIILFTSFPFILYLFHFYEEVEFDNIKSIIKSWSDFKKIKENLRRLKSS